MYTSIRKYLIRWNEQTDTRAKLQHAYVTAAGLAILAAGLLGLVNYDLGQKLVTVALVAIVVFFINFFAWILLDSVLLSRLDKASRSPKKRK